LVEHNSVNEDESYYYIEFSNQFNESTFDNNMSKILEVSISGDAFNYTYNFTRESNKVYRINFDFEDEFIGRELTLTLIGAGEDSNDRML